MQERIGMYKNYRVGKIKYVTSKRVGKPLMLIDAKEYCQDASGNGYWANYNLCILIDENTEITRSDVGRFCEVGFYIQSFRLKDLNATYENVFSMKSFRFLDSEQEAEQVAKRISKSIININN